MTLTVKEMVRQNNEKRKLLNAENETYYENLLVFIRTNPFSKERATEEVLLEMLDHLLQAQKEGKSAEDIFGKTPKELAVEISASLPKESMKDLLEFAFEIMLTLFGWYFAILGIVPLIVKEEQTIYLGSFITSALLLIGCLFIVLYLVFYVLKKNAFEDPKKKRMKIWNYGAIVWLGIVGVFLINTTIKPFGTTVEISYYTTFGVGSFFILAAYLLKKMRETK